MSLNDDLSDLFRTMAAVLDIRGENTFKAIAFSKVGRLLKDLPEDIKAIAARGELKDVQGIGASSQKIIEDYIKTGRSVDYEELVASVPSGLLPLMNIPGMGPKTIALLWKQRGITNLAELIKAIDGGALSGLKGIGEKKIHAIKEGIALRAQASQRMGLPDALAIAEALLERLRQLKSIKSAEIAGSLRRRRETIGDVDLVASIRDMSAGEDVSAEFVKFPEVQKVLAQGSSKTSVLTAGGLQVDLRLVPVESFGAALLYFTGSKDHNVHIRGMALDRKMTLNEWGLYDLEKYEKAKKKSASPPDLPPLAGKTEADIYRRLGMDYIEPELREDRGEVQAAIEKRLPKLIELSDIRGELHCHTIASDGSASIEQMTEAAVARGYEFLAITDHSKSQAIARGLTVDRLMAHVKEIRKIAGKYRQIKLLAGCEVDILADGRMDYEDAVLAELDVVIGSPHMSLTQESGKATDRILRAIENRYVNVIGHPTGRLIDRRAGLPLDMARVIKAASETGTALEINSSFPRFDLNDIHARAAINAGALLSINTDAHSIDELDLMSYGVSVARRAWAEKKHVINAMSASQLQKFLSAKRG